MDAIGLVHDAGAWLAVDGLQPHLTAQALEALAIDGQSVVAIQHRDESARSQAGVAQIEPVKQAFDLHVLHVLLGLRHGLVVQAGA